MNGLKKEKIVVPFDFSDVSVRAVDVALQIADRPEAVTVIHVLPEMSAADPGVVWQTIDDTNRSRHAAEALRTRLSDEKYRQVHVEIAIGDPGYRITDFAQKLAADLIVIPSHGRTGLQRWLIGSVAERVIRLAHCPVLVLRQ